jgi:glucose-6-phosphate isomerase, archaeal
MIPPLENLLSRFDLDTASIGGRPRLERRLSDLRGCFRDPAAYEAALAAGDPLVYTVASVEPGSGEGDLHYGLGMILPGRVGDEYWLTKGHYHAWRPAAEFYIGLRGEGHMLLEDEATGEARFLPLTPHGVVYVPGHTAHRTMNTGSEPLLYLGIYPARAGHDYGSIAESNFRHVVIERDGLPTLLPR